MTRWSPFFKLTLAAAAVSCSLSAAAQAQQLSVLPTSAPSYYAEPDLNVVPAAHSMTYADRMRTLETELADMKSRLASYEMASHNNGGSCGCDANMGCGTCGSDACGCDPCCFPYAGWFVGAELLFLQPHFEDESAFVIDRSHLDEVVAFDYDYDVAPRITVGYANCNGFGGRLRYFTYDNSFTVGPTTLNDDAEAFAFDGGQTLLRRLDADPGDTISARHDLELQALDSEFLQMFQAYNSIILVSAGLRWARIDQDYQVTLDNGEGLFHSYNFDGLGPTVALELWRPFGNRGFSIYGNTRGSILFGETSQTIQEDTVVDLFEDRRDNVDDTIAIGELGLGLQWQSAPVWNSLVFARTGWEGQFWSGAGNANTTDSDLALEGFTLGLGFLR